MRRNNRGRGVTMMMAIVLLALVSMAVVVLAQLIRNDAQRTADGRSDAQLRAFIMAALSDAKTRLEKEDRLPGMVVLHLPGGFSDASVTYVGYVSQDGWQVEIDATENGRTLWADGSFTRQNGAWSLQATKLGRPTGDRRLPTTSPTEPH